LIAGTFESPPRGAIPFAAPTLSSIACISVVFVPMLVVFVDILVSFAPILVS